MQSGKQDPSFFHFLISREQLLNLQTSSSVKPPSKKSVLDIKRQKACQLVKRGELSRAAKLFVSSGLVPVSSETVSNLASKHPARVKNVPYFDEDTSQSIDLSESLFFATLSKLQKCSGSRPSGWNFEHFKALWRANPLLLESSLLFAI